MNEKEMEAYILKIAENAKEASRDLAARTTAEKNNALLAMADAIAADSDRIIAENKKDCEFAASSGKTKAIIERLILDKKRVEAMASAIRDVASLPDPVGSGNLIMRRPNGLKITKVRVPLGVVAMIYESRPNVTADAAALCVKSGNAVILRGGKEAVHSNAAIAACIRSALKKTGMPEDAVQFIEKTEHEIVDLMLKLDKLIDVVIPRGGEALIRSVSEKSLIPVIKHDKGVCHIFVDESALKEKAEAIVINAKCQRPSVCNAAETLLLHWDYPHAKELVEKLIENGVEIYADEQIRKLAPGIKAATEESWTTEYLDLKMSARIVGDVGEAIEHINRYGSHHSDAIVSENYASIQSFLDRVDSAAVYANASTRFTDGSEFGLGAEIGISTQKLHVRGPMGLEGLTCEKWVVYGDGQVR